MNNTIPISILQATSVIKDYADIQEKLIREFERQYHSFRSESDFRIKPKTGVLHVVGEKWKFRKHGLGIDFEGGNPEKIINAHVGIINHKRAFDSWRLSEYFESLNYSKIVWDSNRINIDDLKELDRLLELLNKNNVIKKISKNHKLYEFVN